MARGGFRNFAISFSTVSILAGCLPSYVALHWGPAPGKLGAQKALRVEAKRGPMTGLRQRYGALLVALGVTFFYPGIAQPGDPQRVVATVLTCATLMLVHYAAGANVRVLRVAGAGVLAILVGVVIVSVAGSGPR